MRLKEFWILWLIGALAAPTSIPYAMALERWALGPRAAALEFTVPALLLRLAVAIAILAIAVAAGLWLAPRIGTGAPILERWLTGQRARAGSGSRLGLAAAIGAAAAVYGILVDLAFVWFVHFRVPAPEVHARISVPTWTSALASFSGGIDEELLFRLFLLSLLAWLLARISRDARGYPTSTAFWIANLAGAAAFSAAHFGNFAGISPLGPILALRTLAIIIPVGLVLGWQFWKWGLEAAVVSHFAADVVIHGLKPLLDNL